MLCTEDCKYSRKEHKDSETVRCSICMRWYHAVCVNETHIDAIHTCKSCTNIPLDLSSILSSMTNLHKKIDTLTKDIKCIKTSHENLVKDFNAIKAENDTTKSDNALLRTQILTLRAELQATKWPIQEPSSKPTLVISSSVLRDVDNNKIKDTYVHAISGGKINDATTYLRDVAHDKYGKITLLIGGNDCDESSLAVGDIVRRYNSLIDLAKVKCSDVRIASILPRHCPTSDNNVMERIDSVNAELQVLCEEKECAFVNCNTVFQLQDGSINDGFYLTERNGDKLVHLNDKGTNRLGVLLNIKPKNGTRITKDRQKTTTSESQATRPQHPNAGVRRQRQPPMPHHSNPELHDSHQVSQTPRWARNSPASRPPPQRVQPTLTHDTSHIAEPHRRSRPVTRDNTPPVFRAGEYHSGGYRDDIYRNDITSDHDYNPNYYYEERCFNCGERGHHTDQCWYTERLLCTQCNTYGHKEKYCSCNFDARRSSYTQEREFQGERYHY